VGCDFAKWKNRHRPLDREPNFFLAQSTGIMAVQGKARMLILPAPMSASRYFRRFQSKLAKVERHVLYAAL